MSKFRKRLTDNAGFTLIELLVVIAVLGIMAGIAVPRLTGVTDKAKLSEAESAVGTIKNAVEMYYVEEGNYNVGEAEITSSHALADYIEVDSLPEGWTYEVTTEGDSYSIMVHDGDSADGDPTDLGAKFTKGTGIETTQDGGNNWN